MTSAFMIDEIINPDDWGLRLQITSLTPLEGVIIKNTKPASYVGKFFPVGKTLRFIRCNPGLDSWSIESDDREMPWFILGIYEGRKRFEHYR